MYVYYVCMNLNSLLSQFVLYLCCLRATHYREGIRTVGAMTSTCHTVVLSQVRTVSVFYTNAYANSCALYKAPNRNKFVFRT